MYGGVFRSRTLGLRWSQGLSDYMAELARWGAEEMKDEKLVAMCQTISDAAEVTYYESQLARSLRKPTAESQREACRRYMLACAGVPEDAVQPVLLSAARALVPAVEEEATAASK